MNEHRCAGCNGGLNDMVVETGDYIVAAITVSTAIGMQIKVAHKLDGITNFE